MPQDYVDLGSALGLQSHQRVKSGELTNAANLFINLDQNRQRKDAAERARQQKIQDEYMKSLDFSKAKLDNVRLPKAQEVIKEAFPKLQSASNPMDRYMLQAEYQNKIGNVVKEQEIADANRKAIGNAELLHIPGINDVISNEGYQQFAQQHPIIAPKVFVESGTDVHAYAPTKRLNLEKEFVPTVTALLGNQASKYVGQEGNQLILKQKLPAELIDSLAGRYAADREIGDNLFTQDAYGNEKKVIGLMQQGVSQEEAVYRVQKELAKKQLEQYNYKYSTERANAPRDDDDGFDAGIGQPNPGALNVYIGSGERTGQASSPYAYTIKKTNTVAGASGEVISLKDNKPLDKAGVQDIEYGQIMVLPTFTSGRQPGKVAIDPLVQSTMAQHKPGTKSPIEYKAFVIGNGKDKNGKEISVYRPLEDMEGALISSQTNKKAAKALRQRFNETYDKAKELNGSTTGDSQPQRIRIKRLSDGKVGTILESDFDSTKYQKL